MKKIAIKFIIVLVVMWYVASWIHDIYLAREFNILKHTKDNMYYFQALVYRCTDDEREWPITSLSAALNSIKSQNIIQYNELKSDIKMIIEDRDGWGNSFVYFVNDGYIYLRSKGKNGVDNNGNNDDIQTYIKCDGKALGWGFPEDVQHKETDNDES